jgi:putative DNA primase/helicase
MQMSDTKNWLLPEFENIPDEIKAQPWAVWIAEPRTNQLGKFNKAPLNPVTGRKVGTDKPELFGTFEEAKAAYATGKYTGIGVLLTGNGIVGVDIDDAKETFADKPEIKKWIAAAVNAGAHSEKSPSGTGLRLFMLGKLPAKGRKVGHLEIYDDARFLTVTGNIYPRKKGGV